MCNRAVGREEEGCVSCMTQVGRKEKINIQVLLHGRRDTQTKKNKTWKMQFKSFCYGVAHSHFASILRHYFMYSTYSFSLGHLGTRKIDASRARLSKKERDGSL